MKFANSLVILTLALCESMGYPYYPSYGNVDSVSYGSIDNTRGGLALSRYYNPYYNPRAVGGGMAAFMFRQPEVQPALSQSGQYYLPDRRRQTNIDYAPPQQNEVYYPQQPEPQPEAPVAFPTELNDIAEPTERAEVSTTAKAVEPELAEPEVPEVEEVAEPALKPKKAVSRKKQVKRPVEEDEDEEGYAPRMPASAFFPMFFGWGGKSAGGPGGATAIANAYSTGRGGVATSHATAYGPRPEDLLKKN